MSFAFEISLYSSREFYTAREQLSPGAMITQNVEQQKSSTHPLTLHVAPPKLITKINTCVGDGILDCRSRFIGVFSFSNKNGRVPVLSSKQRIMGFGVV